MTTRQGWTLKLYPWKPWLGVPSLWHQLREHELSRWRTLSAVPGYVWLACTTRLKYGTKRKAEQGQ